MCAYVHTCIHVYVVCVDTRIYIACICTRTEICIYIFVLYIQFVHVCIDVYTPINPREQIHMHASIYVHICMQREIGRERGRAGEERTGQERRE